MCDICRPYGELTEEQIDAETGRIAETFFGLPTVIGAPLLMAEESWREVARHQLELGVRLCHEIPAIKTYSAPNPEDALDARSAAGRWTYLDEYADTETPAERIQRMAREQHQQYLDELARRRRGAEGEEQ